ncbi:MAG TPA: hypothetical protein VHH35_15300 [Pyrinomonadaceae bacterium]|nr:hypothetical protein [Pyrinomonadaceae bacterium]
MRTSLERPDAVTASAMMAREQIGMAVADQIRQMKTAKELNKLAETFLPAFEKFLESPAEKRLRRMRAGVITASIGLGATLVAIVMTLARGEVFELLIPGLVTFFIGLGIFINGLKFTVPRKELPGDAYDAASQRALDFGLERMTYEAPPVRTNELGSATQKPASVTEHTTHNLTTSKS